MAEQQYSSLPTHDMLSQVADQTKDVVSQVADQTKDVVLQVAGQAKELMQTQVAQRTSKSAGDLGELADALRRVSRDMEGRVAAPLMNEAADRLERVSQMLDSMDPNEMVHSVSRFARREPLLFLGGAFALGILGARFLKSSESHLAAPGQTSVSTSETRAIGAETGSQSAGMGRR